MEKLLTMKEVCEIFKVSNQTLRRWEKLKKLKSVRTLGNQRRYKVSDINDIMKKL